MLISTYPEREMAVVHSRSLARALSRLPPAANVAAGVLTLWAKADGQCKHKTDGKTFKQAGRKGVHILWMCIIAYKNCSGQRFQAATVAAWLRYYVDFLAHFDWTALLAKSQDS